MLILGIDIGTTHCKAGIFDMDGRLAGLASQMTTTNRTSEGYYFYDPEQLWQTVASVIKEASDSINSEQIVSVGISSMAEAGLLVDQRTGEVRSHIIPWFDQRSMKQYERIQKEADPFQLFRLTGLHGSYKYGLSKILWLHDQNSGITEDTLWLSVSDYIAYRLTGQFATDESLAARTYAYSIADHKWMVDWVTHFGLKKSLFPAALPSGTPMGTLRGEISGYLGLPARIPIAVSGHDHLCSALAVGALEPEHVFDSIGTAETLVGVFEEKALGEAEYLSGLTYGKHVIKGRLFWMGGLSASGGSLEWVRNLLGENPLSYEEVNSLLKTVNRGPSELIYLPYLSGSGAPHPDPTAQGAFVGLQNHHNRAELIKAVLEGTAYEMESIRRAAQQVNDTVLNQILAVGGGTRNPLWMQIKADISNCIFCVPAMHEATVHGAALVAAIGNGHYASEQEAAAIIKQSHVQIYSPDEERHKAYKQAYEQKYLRLQEPLRHYYRSLSNLNRY